MLRYHLILTMTAGCVRQLICSAHDRISEKVNLKVCCFESSKQKRQFQKMSSLHPEMSPKTIISIMDPIMASNLGSVDLSKIEEHRKEFYPNSTPRGGGGVL